MICIKGCNTCFPDEQQGAEVPSQQHGLMRRLVALQEENHMRLIFVRGQEAVGGRDGGGMENCSQWGDQKTKFHGFKQHIEILRSSSNSTVQHATCGACTSHA